MQVEKLGHKLLVTFLAVATVAGQLYNEWLEGICLWRLCLEDICPILAVAAVVGGHLYNEFVGHLWHFLNLAEGENKKAACRPAVGCAAGKNDHY